MLVNFADKETQKIWSEQRSKCFPADIQQRALIKLAMISQALDINDLRIPPANRLEALKGNRKVNSVFASTNNGAFTFAGKTATLMMLKSRITIETHRKKYEKFPKT